MLTKTYFSVDVGETDKNRQYWASRQGLSENTILSIQSADIVLVPWENRDGLACAFPTETTSFFEALSDSLEAGQIAVAVESSQYSELMLHGGEVRWPSLIISTLALNTLANVLSAEIEKKVSEPSPPSTIEINVIVENEFGKCISIDYKGPPTRLVETLTNELERCVPGHSSREIKKDVSRKHQAKLKPRK